MADDTGHDATVGAVVNALVSTPVPMVTLLGPGGAGKTYLANRVVRRLVDDGFVARVVTIELTEFGSASDGMAAVVATLREVDAGLLVVQNLECVLLEARELAAALAERPGVRVLATGRAPAGITAEKRITVPALPLHGPTAGPQRAAETALGLLREHARRSSRELDTADREDLLAAICLRMECNPLALIIAAAQLSDVTASTLLNRLDQGWSPLMQAPLDLPGRHGSLERVIADTVTLLSPLARSLFGVLAPFEASFDAASAAVLVRGTTVITDEDVVAHPGDPTGLLAPLRELIAHNLLVPVDDEAGEGPELYVLGALARDYARHLSFGSSDGRALSSAHADVMLGHVRAGGGLTGADAEAWVQRLDAWLPDLRRALDHLVRESDPRALEFAALMRPYWVARGMLHEGVSSLTAALGNGEATGERDWVQAYWARALLDGAVSSYAKVKPDLQICVDAWERLDDPLQRARALVDLAAATFEKDGFGDASGHFTEAISLLDSLGDRWNAARARSLFGASAATVPEHRLRAMELLDQAVDDFRALGETVVACLPLQHMGRLLVEDGHESQALTVLNHGLRLSEAAGDGWNASVFHNLLAEAEVVRGNPMEAARHHLEALRLSSQISATARFIWCLEGLAVALDELGEKEYAARLLGLVQKIRSSLNLSKWTEFPARAIDLGAVGHGLVAHDVAALKMEGEQLTVADVLAQVPELLSACVEQSVRNARPRASHGLTPREMEVLRLIASGKTSRTAAAELYISIETVGRHISNTYRKIGVSGRAEATAFAINSGFMDT